MTPRAKRGHHARTEVSGQILGNRIFVQMRTGASADNPLRLYLDGTDSAQLPGGVPMMLELFAGPIDPDSEPRAYVEGGEVPEDKVFEITRIEWQATTHGDSSGSGGMRIEVAGEQVASI
ncbi:MAG: hypothetical protein ACI8QZ_000675 [Chlamydiales bacterium]